MIFPVLSDAVAIPQEEDDGDEDHSDHRGGGEIWLNLSWIQEVQLRPAR